MSKLIYCTAEHISGIVVHVELTALQAHAPADTWSDERVGAIEDLGGEMRLHDVRLADLSGILEEF
jgi:hypothetical protein